MRKKIQKLWLILALTFVLCLTACGSETVSESTIDSKSENISECASETSEQESTEDTETLVSQILSETTTAVEEVAGAEEPAETMLDSELQIHFIDVGQADSTLITVGDHAMLIDCAESDKGTRIQSYLQKQGVKKLDYLILTHPDSDHIGGASVIITKFDIDQVFMSNFEKDNKTYRNLIQTLGSKAYKYSTPAVGTSYDMGQASFTILGPNKVYEDPNDASIALLITYGKNRFLFTGDAEEAAEADIVNTGMDLKADVYQVGHHGSNSSTTDAFLDAVSPSYAVISCGEGNSYGHPRAATMNKLRAAGVKVFRTDEQGTIVLTSDGNQITWNMAPSETWQAGEPTGSSQAPSAAVTQPEATQAVEVPAQQPQETPAGVYYIVNKNSHKIHISTCKSLPKPENQIIFNTLDEVYAAGYSDLCGNCMK